MAAASGQIRYKIYINYGDLVSTFKITFGGEIIITENSYETTESYSVSVTSPTSTAKYWTITLDADENLTPTIVIESPGYVTENGTLVGATNNTKGFVLKPLKLYAYASEDESGYFGYLSSLPPVVGKSVLYDENGTIGDGAFEFGGYYTTPYGERISAVSGDTITVNAYIEPI